MFHSTNTNSHVTIIIITIIRAQISRQVLSEKVTVRLEPDLILRERGGSIILTACISCSHVGYCKAQNIRYIHL